MGVVNLQINHSEDVDLIISALEREKQLLDLELRNITEKLSEFEVQYNIISDIFYEKYQNGEMGDNEDVMKWAGEYQLIKRLQNRFTRIGELIEECQKQTSQ